MQWLKRIFLSEYLVLALCVLYFLALAPFTPGFVSGLNLRNILSDMLPLLVVATGLTLVLIIGGIDLSVVSVIALSSVVGALVMNREDGWLAGHALSIPAGILAMVAVGVVIGALNGLAVVALKMPPFIVTLTLMMFVSGFAIWLTQSDNIAGLPEGFTLLGRRTGWTLAIAAALTLAAHVTLSRSLFGRWLYAIGHNPATSLISGVPVHRVVLATYILSGLCAGMASILYTGRLETGSPVLLDETILLDIIGATVIGGTSLYGGQGKILWTVFGVLFLTLIDNSLNLLNLSHFFITMVKGLVILLAAVLDTLRNRIIAAN